MSQNQPPPANTPHSMPPMEDTQPRITVQPPDAAQDRAPAWGRAVGWAALIGAGMLALGTIALLLLPDPAPPVVPETDSAQVLQAATDLPPTPTLTQPTITPQTDTADTGDAAPVQPVTENQAAPTVAPVQLAALLQTPVAPLSAEPLDGGLHYDPFTIVPPRPRTEFTEYTVVAGDTISTIAARYNLEPETLAWCNDPQVIFLLRPGDVLQVPPTNGACHRVLGTRNQTIADIAAEYEVEDPYQIIDSPFNAMLYGRSPGDVLPGGIPQLFVPGGIGPVVTWRPPVERETDAAGNVLSVAFASGQAGSCGAVGIGGGEFWTNPLPNGTWMRGFFPGHSGIDLAAPTGTPIFAANGGPVLFSGFSRYGYGETVVLAHGAALSTLYGHMSSRAVFCGSYAAAGTIIGYVGSTGNSSGPHLHFEIRSNDIPQNPSGTPGIGW